MRDEEIIHNIVNGKTMLFSEIISRYQSKVFSTVYGYTHNYEEAKDLTQEVFIKLYNNLHKYKDKSKFSTWLYRIAVNHCIDWFRKNKKHSDTIFCADGEEIDILNTEAIGESPEERYIKQEYIDQIRDIIEILPDIYKTVLILYYLEDFNTKEISEILEIPKKTVDTRLFRAKKMMKNILTNTVKGGEQLELQQI